METVLAEKLRSWAEKYNNPEYFKEDPIAFPRLFFQRGASLQDIEVAAVFAAHFAWGRRSMIHWAKRIYFVPMSSMSVESLALM